MMMLFAKLVNMMLDCHYVYAIVRRSIICPNANCEASEWNVTIAPCENIRCSNNEIIVSNCECFLSRKIIITRKVIPTKFYRMQGDILHRIKYPMENDMESLWIVNSETGAHLMQLIVREKKEFEYEIAIWM